MTRKPQHPAAVSVIFAIVIVTIMLIVAGTMATSFLRASDRSQDMFRGTQAYYAARAAMEEAFAEASAYDVGYEHSEAVAFSADTTGGVSDDVFGGYDIYAQSKPLDWLDDSSESTLFVPIPGTGEAASGCELAAGEPWESNENDDCNWNTIAYQETVTIPFYYDSGGAIVNPTGSFEVVLRMRTPDGENLSANLDDKIVVYWEFTGTCDDGSIYKCSLKGEYQDFWTDTRIFGADFPATNDEIWEDGDETTEGEADQAYPQTSIIDFLTANYGDPHTIDKPVLKLTILHPLVEFGDSETLPYLEYQLQVNEEISDTKIIYTSRGEAVGRQGTYVRNLQASQSIGTGSVINFVIQN